MLILATAHRKHLRRIVFVFIVKSNLFILLAAGQLPGRTCKIKGSAGRNYVLTKKIKIKRLLLRTIYSCYTITLQKSLDCEGRHRSFDASVPAKPLYDAQIVRDFFYDRNLSHQLSS